MSTLLVGDIGGTNARFGMARRDTSGRIIIEDFLKRPGDDFPTLKSALQSYIDTIKAVPTSISLAVAGPIKNGHVRLTNRDWDISEDEMCEISGVQQACLFNDFAAMARSVPEMDDQDFESVYAGNKTTTDSSAPVLVAGPGTGFGVGYVLPIDGHYKILTTEGGHVAYAPQNEIEVQILKILQKEHDFVSLELVASGSGLEPVHKAICERRAETFTPLTPAQIMQKAQQGDALCQEICDVRAAATMGAIGDLALSGGARGGIVLAGGVSERMIDFFKTPQALARYLNRGPRTEYIRDIPIQLMTNPKAPLIGAAALFMDKYND